MLFDVSAIVTVIAILYLNMLLQAHKWQNIYTSKQTKTQGTQFCFVYINITIFGLTSHIKCV